MRIRKCHLVCRYDDIITGHLDSKGRAEAERDLLASYAREQTLELGEGAKISNDFHQGYHIRTIEVIDFN